MLTKLGVFYLLFSLPFSINAAFYGLEDIFSIRELKLSLGYPIDSLLNFTELVSKYGYRVQEHTVTTEDGYILKIFRLHGKNCRQPLRQPPVLLMHGLLMTSDLWLDSGPNAGLAYLIADACYDLWVGNIRGNYYGKSHKKLNPETDSDFWEFTLTEVGHFDMPAMIDYILIHTKNEFINYIGYSQGGSIYFIMCSERPNYCDKTRVAIMLAPGSRLKNVDSTILRYVGPRNLMAYSP
ncbi:lipase 1-like [Battus philenor]|uniref:lipase 1-like n=1 Tax=Battus philenor TaxID=42288 RepID=UPI0035D0B1CA